MDTEEKPWTAVVSSQIGAICIHKGELWVRFLKGGIYRYETGENTQHLFTGLLESGSPGAYLSQHVKGIYVYEKVS